MKQKQNNAISPYSILRAALAAIFLLAILLIRFSNRDSSASIEEVSQQVLSAISTDSMQESGSRMLKKLYDLDADSFDGMVLYTPVTNMDVTELLIVRLASDDQADLVTEAVNSRLKTQKNSFEGYGVEQTALLNGSVLDVEGNFILYVVHPDVQAAQQAFLNSL
ncbi:MAG TPA: DUF4358 domain-containing protein [Candidatus Pullilachnospira intestinigallinarum]|nr:DUF4358 domain-containing protein [Candidatus Pullilachnospira intestinigallinarum]